MINKFLPSFSRRFALGLLLGGLAVSSIYRHVQTHQQTLLLRQIATSQLVLQRNQVLSFDQSGVVLRALVQSEVHP
jgi:hypothetical protein